MPKNTSPRPSATFADGPTRLRVVDEHSVLPGELHGQMRGRKVRFLIWTPDEWERTPLDHRPAASMASNGCWLYLEDAEGANN